MIRVAIDAHMLGDGSGGNESHYLNLINHLPAEEFAGQIELVLFVKPEYNISNIKIPCEIITFQSKSAMCRNFIEIPQLVRTHHIDVLHMQYFIPFRPQLPRDCKVIVTIHDISFEHYKDIFTRKDYMLQKLLIPYAARKSDMIFTVSEFSKNDILEKYRIAQDKIKVIYNGASDLFYPQSFTKEERNAFLSQYGISKPYILCVGNLQPRKNIARLLQAYKMLNREDIQLVLVGAKAWMFQEIFEKIDKLYLQDQVICPGYVSTEELAKIYNMAEMFVYPSYFEGFGIPVLEAMKCEIPVATSNITSLPEVGGDAVIYFNPFDTEDICAKMTQLLDDKNLCQQLRNKEKTQAQNFEWNALSLMAMTYYTSYSPK